MYTLYNIYSTLKSLYIFVFYLTIGTKENDKYP